jgi:hypothetical protein
MLPENSSGKNSSGKEANRNLLRQARLVVVVSAIPVETCQKVASAPGPKTANLIFALDRKQKYPGAFLQGAL